jgi:hypothetical protein
VFLLITGASGAGKSTVRRAVAPQFRDVLEAAELAELGGEPQWTLAWRHQAVERAVCRALAAQAADRHFLLCGDPVPPGEVIAAPSADGLNGLAVCLLDVRPEVQSARLRARGDDPSLLPRHHAFAEWMRHHVSDATHRPDVIVGDGWGDMRWDRWVGPEGIRWTAEVIDTSDLTPAEVATRASAWVRRALDRA